MSIVQILIPYLALCGGILLEGESFLLAASISAHYGYMNIYIIILLTILCTQLSDWFWFLTGRQRGLAIIQKRPMIQKKIKVIYQFIDKYPIPVLFFYRFVYGFRSIMPLVLGTSHVKKRHFFIFGLSSTIIWSSSFAALGFYFGSVIQARFQLVKQYEYSIIISLLISALLIIFINQLRKRRRKASSDNSTLLKQHSIWIIRLNAIKAAFLTRNK
jgi:membrane protein DedA with SNARE-associated domain